MELQYIIIRAKKSVAKISTIHTDFKKVLQEASFNIQNDIITFDLEGKTANIHYKMNHNDNNVLYFKVSSELSVMKAVEELDRFNEMLINGKHREKFYIINSYNEASQVLCCKLMPLLGIFERRLREFIYLTVTKSLGQEWINTISEQLKNSIKQRSKGSVKADKALIEKSLEWLEFEELKNYLFAPYSDVNPDESIQEILSNESISKEEILLKIEAMQKKSLWDKLFQNYDDLKELKNKITRVQQIRNDVMHNKSISLSFFNKSRNEIKEINEQLLAIISSIENDSYDEHNTITIDVTTLANAILQSMEKTEKEFKFVEIGEMLVEKFNNGQEVAKRVGEALLKFAELMTGDEE